jgi:hypothetical protein
LARGLRLVYTLAISQGELFLESDILAPALEKYIARFLLLHNAVRETLAMLKQPW